MSFASAGFVARAKMMHKFERGKTKVPTFAHAPHFKAIAIPLHGLQCGDTPEIKISPVYLQSEPRKGGLIIAMPKIKNVSAKKITIKV